jgi:hypothetical protein
LFAIYQKSARRSAAKVCGSRKVTFLFARSSSAKQPAENNQSCMKRYQNFSQFLQMKLKQARRHLINVYRFIGTVKHSKALFK